MPISLLQRRLANVMITVGLLTSPGGKLLTWRTKLIDARGTGEPQGVPTMFYILIQKTIHSVLGGVSLPVKYRGPQQNATSGERFAIDIVNRSPRDCPKQKYGLFGYSQGATLMFNALSRLNKKALDVVG
ncbi:hypothetical protein SI65_09334 [Aspergillus cristatus]|uniref:Uncharacterized protein n=1 Tax=Aspergillus cristatus TaxID=573508 RepID=A0A1E3B371_ASPCR|nr:hypothetical protein SI65_09334 [Aspergillus cristatus]